MQYSEGNHGQSLPPCGWKERNGFRTALNCLPKNMPSKQAICTLIGGIDGGNIVAGPRDGNAPVIKPILRPIDGAHEAVAMGTLFPNEDGTPVLHMHAALGRDGKTRTGCIRPGLDIWLIGEVIIMEILNTDMLRKKEPKSGLALLCKK